MEYKHGGDIYRNSAEYDFSVNINPLGMPLGSIQAAHEGIVLSGRYPDYMGEKLCGALAEYFALPQQTIILGNGAAELIYALCHALSVKVGLVIAPTFSEYARALTAAGSRVAYHMLCEKNAFALDEAVLDCIDQEIGLVFLCNPNNPTGKLTDRGLLGEIADRCEKKGVFLCIDESFLPFVPNHDAYTMTGSGELMSHDRLIVLRSFTKIYGMAGLRLGCALSGNSRLLGEMRRHMQPWNTSVPAQMAGYAALKDMEFAERTRELIAAERGYLVRELTRGLADKLYEGAANYILFRSGAGLYDRLLKQGIMIRRCGDFEGLSDVYYRIGVRSRSENQMLVKRWRQMLDEQGK